MKIEDIGEVKSGKRLPKGHSLISEITPNPYIRLVDIYDGKIRKNNIQYLDKASQKKICKYIVETDDVVLAIVGHTIGMVFNVDSEWNKSNLTENAARITNLNEKVFHKFLYYYLLSPYGQQEILSRKVGSAQGKLPLYNIKSLEVPIPPLYEQKAIAHILSVLDDKIELNRQMNETLEAMAQALFKSWFVDFDPVIDNALLAGKSIPDELAERAELRQAQLDSGEAKTNSQINDLFPSEFEFTEELGWIPKGWRVSPLPEVMDFLEGPGIRNWQYTEEEDGIKFINIRCIQNGDINLKTANKITREEAFGKYKHFQLEVDDIIMSASGTLGRYAFVRQEHLPLSLNTSVIRFRPINGVSTLYYIAGYIDTKLQWELETRASGSVQRNFGPMHLKKITMFVPDINVLEEHARLSSEIFNKRRNNLEQIDTLIQLRDTLLPKLMSGELRIPDAEKLVEDI